MNLASTTPALVTQRAAQRLPRTALWLLCAAYVLPGVFGRDPWRNADLTAFGLMLGMAQGRTPWLAPTLGGLPPETALLPHWLGALAIKLLPVLDPALAARLPFALLLTLTLTLVWYVAFYLARTEAAQPVAFAFGGEAEPLDYARALADAAVLATVATLGLLQLGHETTPELVQLFEVACFTWALASAPFRGLTARLMAPTAMIALALSGAPTMAMGFGTVATLVCWRSRYAGVRALLPWLLVGMAATAGLGWLFSAWQWRVALPARSGAWLGVARLLVWFCWPAWPLALWTLWRWRDHWQDRHIAVPLCTALVALAAAVVMGGSDRALMLAAPGLAVLAAFALPTLGRSTGAAMDWFSVFFFSIAAIVGWVVYVSMQTGVPAQPLINIQRLAPGFLPRFSALALGLALAGTAAWLWLVRWRTSRHRHPIWKSLVLPAGGVTLAWLLAMTLWLPALDHARSPRPLIALVGRHVPEGSCVRGPGLGRPMIAALEVFGRYRVFATDIDTGPAHACDVLLVQAKGRTSPAAPPGWSSVAKVVHPADRTEQIWIFRRQP